MIEIDGIFCAALSGVKTDWAITAVHSAGAETAKICKDNNMILFVLLTILLVLIALAFFRASIAGWGLGTILTLFFMSSVTRLSDETLLMLGLGLSNFFVLLGIPWVRRSVLSTPLLRRLQRTLPTFEVPLTEMGVGGWEAGLFHGHPEWKQWLTLPKWNLTTEEQAFLQEKVEPLVGFVSATCVTPEAEQWMREHNFPSLMDGTEDKSGLSMQAYVSVVSRVAAQSRVTALKINDQVLAQPARDVGEILQRSQSLPYSARALAMGYLLEAALQLTATASDSDTDSRVMEAAVCHQAHQGAQRVLTEYTARAASWYLLEDLAPDVLSRQVFAQGVLRLHPYLFREISALQLKNAELAPLKFDVAVREHLRYMLSNVARSWVFGLIGGKGMLVPGGHETLCYYQRLTHFSVAFALCCDAVILMVCKTAQRQENLYARLGEIFAGLYVCAAALKRYEDSNRPKQDLAKLEWAVQDVLYQVQQTFLVLLQNMPSVSGWCLKRIIFPLGLTLLPPSDALTERVIASQR